MIRQMISAGFNLYTLPARMAYRSTAGWFGLPQDFDQFVGQLRTQSEEVTREVQRVIEGVDLEMRQKAAHLSPEQREQAAELAIHSAEQHLSMAAVNVLRAFWLATSARRGLADRDGSTIIDHEG